VNNPRFEPVVSMWRTLAGTPSAFTVPETTIVRANPNSHICPSGWVGFVRLGTTAVITTPDDKTAAAVEEAMPTSGDSLLALLAPKEVLGPAVLLYLDPDEFTPADASEVDWVMSPDPYVRELEALAGSEDAGEAGVSMCRSPIFVTWSRDGHVTAAAGYTPWLDRVAHVSVLTRPDHRGQGLGQLVATAAVQHAVAKGLIAQWRARITNTPSIGIANALGFHERGLQVSLRL
jgi:RimJ/RimL family protein N-acetyltransferase